LCSRILHFKFFYVCPCPYLYRVSYYKTNFRNPNFCIFLNKRNTYGRFMNFDPAESENMKFCHVSNFQFLHCSFPMFPWLWHWHMYATCFLVISLHHVLVLVCTLMTWWGRIMQRRWMDQKFIYDRAIEYLATLSCPYFGYKKNK